MGEGDDEHTLEGQTISKRPRFDVLVRDIVRRCREILYGVDDCEEQ